MTIEVECFVKITSECEVNSMKLYVDVYFLSKPYLILTRVYSTCLNKMCCICVMSLTGYSYMYQIL